MQSVLELRILVDFSFLKLNPNHQQIKKIKTYTATLDF